MGVLAGRRAAWVSMLAALAGAAGCYSPSLADCTVSCSGPSECASGQVCGTDGLCAAPEIAGRCAVPPDAALDAGVVVDAPIAMMIDAAMPDAPPLPAMVRLRVQIVGKGRVVVDGRGTCSASMGPGGGDCAFDVARGVAQTVRATPVQIDQWFLSWTSPTCRGQSATCTFTPTGETLVVAQFGKAGRDSER